LSEAGSGIEGLRPDSGFARLVGMSLKSETFKLVDVGCAGGLPSGWRTFGDRLAAIGFDAEGPEVDRLNAAEQNPLVRYVAGFIGLPEGHPLKVRIGAKAYWHIWVDKRLSYERSHAIRADKAAGRTPADIDSYFRTDVLGQDWSPFPVQGFDLDYARTFEVFEPTQAEAAASLADQTPNRVIHLPAFIKGSGFDDADFLKIDIDGPDYEVLRSATGLLARPSLLGVALEVCFYGSHDANDNSFHNMDRLMREKGFELYGLSVRTYGNAALPLPYLDVHPSMSANGRPLQGDAIYIRDLASRARQDMAAGLSDEKLAKTAALFALFSLPDVAAEMLTVHRHRLSRLFDVDDALDLLAADVQQDDPPPPMSYRDYMAAWESEAPRFFDQYTKRNDWFQGLMQTARAAPALETERAALVEERDALQARLAQIEPRHADVEARGLHDLERLRQAEAELTALKASKSWLITAPLRRLIGG
jgi:hypothetical protein